MPEPPKSIHRAASRNTHSPKMSRPRPYAQRSNIRRVFRKSASQEARVFLIRTGKGKRVFFRVDKNPELGIVKFVFQKIFYALYPEYSIKPLNLVVATVDNKQLLGMTSEIVRDRSPNYKLFHHTFYTDYRAVFGLPHIEFADKHNNIVKKIRQESGIEVNNNPVNMIDQNGKPIFVEIENISPFAHRKLLNALNNKGINISKLREDILNSVPPDKRRAVSSTLELFISS